MLPVRAVLRKKTLKTYARALSSTSPWAVDVPTVPIAGSHEVLNQSSAMPDVNLYKQDQCLQDAIRQFGGCDFENQLLKFGNYAGAEATRRRHRDANDFSPTLRNFDKNGRRVDQVDYHPAYHALFASGVAAEVPSLAFRHKGAEHVHTAMAALFSMQYQADYGVSCPLSMTSAAVPALANEPSVAAEWVPRLTSAEYDPRDAPAALKRGCTMGMSMTEKQGGSDVRANSTTATALDSNGDYWSLTGHKWFTSAPMSDAFLTLAQVQGKGITCFLVPRWLPNGDRNSNFHVMRLKNKMGDRSNASSEVEYHGAWAQRVGPLGRGVSVIVDMVVSTRLHCALGSASLQRQALRHAIQHAHGRSAFGSVLYEAPAMRALLSDLGIESEANTAMAFFAASLFDACEVDPTNVRLAALKRLVTALTKFWTTKRTPQFVYEAMEAHGGNGYVYEWDMPRMFQQAPLNSIWEGSGNTIVLDVLRTVAKEPAALEELLSFLGTAAQVEGAPETYLRAFEGLRKQLAEAQAWLHAGDTASLQFSGRQIVDSMSATLASAVLLNRMGSLGAVPEVDGEGLAAVAKAYCNTRLGAVGGQWQLSSANYGSFGPGQLSRDAADAVLARQFQPAQ